MMKYFFLLVISIVMIACGGPSQTKDQNPSNEVVVEAQKSIVIYGSMQCSHCVDFKTKLDSAGLTYTFNDVDESDQYYNEMRNLIQAARVTGRVSFPIVLVDSKELFIAPQLSEVMAVIR